MTLSSSVSNYSSATSLNYSSSNATYISKAPASDGGLSTAGTLVDLIQAPAKVWDAGIGIGNGINEAIFLTTAYGFPWNWRGHLDEYDEMEMQMQLAKCERGETCRDPATGQLLLEGGPYAVREIAGDMNGQGLTAGSAGRQTVMTSDGAMSYYQRPIEVKLQVPPSVTHTETKGKSRGGAQTTTSEKYEEHTVTEGEAFSNSESWGNATSTDSSHAADLWFSYKVRNAGTEYAHEICNLTFNVYLNGELIYTYFVPSDRDGACFTSLEPGEEHLFSARTDSHAIPLSLDQLEALDVTPNCAQLRDWGDVRPYSDGGRCPGGKLHVAVEGFMYGFDERLFNDAANSTIIVSIEDGTDDGDEAIDTYLIPTWISETVLNVLGRFFPHETDLNGMMTAIWTPEYRSDTLAWCQAPRRPTDPAEQGCVAHVNCH
ncbi:MAG: hypothetical protein KIT77_03110 [Caldilinea sp.]|nr:hypothetical protein [Caldilinea sp.]